MENSHLAEVIYLFVDGQVAAELTFSDFEQHIGRQTPLPGAPSGASVCRAGYVIVGPDLKIEGMVFFLLQVDEQGRPDKNFRVPLPYLAKNAGPGPDLGSGPVPMACRGSCSVPWHANNLWDPTHDGAVNPIDALVTAIATNRLELNPQAPQAPVENEISSGVGAGDPGAMVTELSARHTQQLMVLQEQHEDELAAQQELMEAKLELYRQEIMRLRDALAQAQTQPTSAAQSSASNFD